MIFNQSLKNTEAENHYTDLSLSLYLKAGMIFPTRVVELLYKKNIVKALLMQSLVKKKKNIILKL